MTSTPHPATLAGTWRLDRRVADRAARLRGVVHGRLTVTPAADGALHWHEAGQFTWAAPGPDGRTARHQAPVTRDLVLRDTGGQWWMTFQDGRPFHPWRSGQPVDHPCGEDHYHGWILVDRDGARLRTLWDVTGPSKDQRLITRFTRL